MRLFAEATRPDSSAFWRFRFWPDPEMPERQLSAAPNDRTRPLSASHRTGAVFHETADDHTSVCADLEGFQFPSTM